MKISILAYLFLLVFSLAEAAPITGVESHFIFPKPASMTSPELNEFNIYLNGLEYGVDQYNRPGIGKETSNLDYIARRKLDNNHGVIGIAGAKVVRRTAILNAPVQLLREPNGEPLSVKYNSNYLVLVSRELEKWRFVTDGDNAGWISEDKLSPPPSTIYVRSENGQVAQNGVGLEEAQKEWRLYTKDLANRTELNKPLPRCPDKITDLEKDGLVGENSPEEVRYNLYVKCGQGKNKESFPKVKNIRMIRNSCQCQKGNAIDGYKEVVTIVKGNENFKISERESKEDCDLGQKFVICVKPGACYSPDPKYSECSMPKYDFWACPKDCLIWD